MFGKTIPQNIEINCIDVKSIMNFLLTWDGIVFVTEQGKLVGAITDGDIKRSLRRGQNAIDESIVNRNIKCIVQDSSSDDCFVMKEAKKIFERYSKIHNIPVTDDSGHLLYQIIRGDRERLRIVRRYLDLLLENDSLRIFLKCHEIEHIVLAGGNLEFLEFVRKLLGKVLHRYGNELKVEICLLRDTAELEKNEKKTVVICILNSLIDIFRKIIPFDVLVYPLQVIPDYFYYTVLDDMHRDTIANFIELFGYDELIFLEDNKYTRYAVDMVKKCGVFANIENRVSSDKYQETDIMAYCQDKSYTEKFSIQEFTVILQAIQRYQRISEQWLKREKYVEEYIACLEAMKLEGFGGLVFKQYNLLDQKVYRAIKKWGKDAFDVKLPDEQKSTSVDWIDATKESWGNSSAEFTMTSFNMQYKCVMAILYDVCYKLMSMYCNNVYVHTMSYRGARKREESLHPNRGIYGYIYGMREDFPLNFIEKIFGRADYPIEGVIEDTAGCERVCMNDVYVKYQSNYQSEYFNTDTFGNRITVDMPSDYIGTVWLLGACLYSGYAVNDSDTTSSLLQKRINKSGKKYRVVNMGVAGGNIDALIGKFYDKKIGVHDIVVFWAEPWNRQNDRHVIPMDIDEFVSQLGEEYWDELFHCGKKGYEILSKQIYDKIEKDLIQVPERTFFLHENIEREISVFLSNIQNQIMPVLDNNVLQDTSKRKGAIVMNCNPFTYGHQYLIETASRMVDILYIFVVEEDKSVFPFADRIHLVREGVRGFSNVVVLPSGKFMISSITFPGYFTKGNPDQQYYDSFLDLKIFAHYIAPFLGIGIRFVGEEPFDPVTAQYNRDMKTILGEQNINVLEIPRKKLGDEVISATQVRLLLEGEEYELLQKYVPESTFRYLENFWQHRFGECSAVQDE